MTKKQMVEQIQVAEARAWKDYRIARKVMGEDDSITARRRGEWSTIHELKEQLGIASLGIRQLIDRDLVPA